MKRNLFFNKLNLIFFVAEQFSKTGRVFQFEKVPILFYFCPNGTF